MPPPHRSTRLRRVAPVLLLCGVLPAVVSSGVPTAEASSVYLCTGYKPCAQEGYSHHGYAAASGEMYWRMYSGHNCTNYVAYRLIQAGMSTERPWSGTGMAYNWGRAMKSITDTRPSVGAVAWWESGASGVGSSGHVAIVEQVVSATEIIISEDSWSGDFHWRRILKDGTSWPTGFIHFVDKTVENTTPPQVTGTPQVGQELRVAKGRWTPTPTFGFQWLADRVAIPGATEQTFTPGPDEVGAAISVRVTARREDYTPGVLDTPATEPVVKGELTSTAPPVVSGDAEVDAVLDAEPGSWSVPPESTTYRWKSDGAVIPGASASSLTLTRAMVGTTITAVEVARRAGFVTGTVQAPQAVGPVVEGTIELLTPFSASGRNHLGASLTVAPGTTQPSDVAASYVWTRDGVEIPGASGATYTLTSDDVGRAIAAHITLSKPRYAPIVRTMEFARTTTPSTVTVRPTGRPGRAVVQVQVTAEGVGAGGPGGEVTVRIGEASASATLVDGRARVVLSPLKAGERTVTVRYAGDGVARPARGTAPVTVTKATRVRE